MELATQDFTRPSKTEVLWTDLFALLELPIQSPPVFAAFEHLDRFLKMSDIELYPAPPPELLQIHTKFHIPFISKANRLFKSWGFCPYILSTVTVDMGQNQEWMDTVKKTSSSSSSGAINTKVKVPVLTVPSPGTYRVFVVLDEATRTERIECIATKLSNTEDLPVIGVYYSTLIDRPRWLDGKIQSPLQTLLTPFRNLCLTESFRLTAQFANAHPTVILQHKDLNSGNNGNALTRSMVEELYGESDFNPHGEPFKYKIRSEREDYLSNDIRQFSQKVRQNLDERVSYYSNPLSTLNTRVELKRPVETSTFTLIEELEVSKHNPPEAKPPVDSEFSNRQYMEFMCQVFGIPVSFFSRDRAVGTGSGFADNDLKVINKTIKATQSDLEQLMMQMIPALDLTGYEFRFHSQTFIEFEMLLSMYELGAMTKTAFRIETENAYSLPRHHVGEKKKRNRRRLLEGGGLNLEQVQLKPKQTTKKQI